MGMSQSYGTPDDVESAATIDRAIELGCIFFDTAEAYGPFTNETLLGRCLRVSAIVSSSRRSFGFTFDGKDHQRRRQPTLSHPRSGGRLPEASADGPDRSLYQHRVDPKVPIEDVAAP